MRAGRGAEPGAMASLVQREATGPMGGVDPGGVGPGVTEPGADPAIETERDPGIEPGAESLAALQDEPGGATGTERLFMKIVAAPAHSADSWAVCAHGRHRAVCMAWQFKFTWRPLF